MGKHGAQIIPHERESERIPYPSCLNVLGRSAFLSVEPATATDRGDACPSSDMSGCRRESLEQKNLMKNEDVKAGEHAFLLESIVEIRGEMCVCETFQC